MRIRVSHQIVHRFAPPARTVNQILRLTPLSFDSQYVLRWRLVVDADGALRGTEDAHGNAVTSYSHHGLIERLTISAAGEIETSDAAGVVRGAAERLPAEMYLRDSPHTHANGALRAFAAEATEGAADPLDSMHRLMGELHETIALQPDEKDAAGSAIEAFALGGDGRATSPTFLSPVRDGAGSRRVSSRAIASAMIQAERAHMSGRKLIFKASDGSRSMRPLRYAPTTAMSGLLLASTAKTAR